MNKRKGSIGILLVVILFTIVVSMNVHANELEVIANNDDISEEKILDDYKQFKENEIVNTGEENNIVKFDSIGINKNSLEYISFETSTMSLDEEVSSEKDSQETHDNTDPNFAYILTPYTEYQGTIVSENEIRWYAMEITEKSKSSILTRSNDNVDTDIYLFKLNVDSMQLESTNQHATSQGNEQYFSSVLDAGIYFVAVLGVSGTGNFILDYFENSDYTDLEINDSITTAQWLGSESSFSGGSATGIIDTMRDVDFYKINVSTLPVLINVSFSAPGNNRFVWMQTNDSAEMLSYENNQFILAPGIHYFAIYDTKNEFYVDNNSYSVDINVISGNLTKDMKATSYKYYPDLKLMMQFYPDLSRYYINGKYINISCSFGDNIGSNPNNPMYRKWSINLYGTKGLVFNIKDRSTDYNSKLKNKRISGIYKVEIGSPNGNIVFGSRYWEISTSKANADIKYAIVIIDAFDGTVADIINPDPNPFD